MNQQYQIAPSIIGMFGNRSFDMNLRLTTAMFGATASFVPNDFIYSFPTSSADQAGAFVCPISGFRAAGHSKKIVDGIAFIDEYAPYRVTK